MNLVRHEKGSAAVDRYANSTPTIAVTTQLRHRHAAHTFNNYPAVVLSSSNPSTIMRNTLSSTAMQIAISRAWLLCWNSIWLVDAVIE